RFHLDVPGWFRATDRASFLTDVAAAVWNDRVVELDYDRWAGRVRRRVAPLGLVLKGGSGDVVATPAAAGGGVMAGGAAVRTYRVSRIQALTLTPDVFVRPERFDLAAFWAAWSDRYERSVLQGEAVLRLSPRALALLGGWWGPVASAAATDTAGAPDAAG